MGKHGPCRHCGVTSTPLWRNGPPEKPVLCNACGSRWRTKGSLANYFPLHNRELAQWEEPKVAKRKCISFKTRKQKLHKGKQVKDLVENDHEILFSKSEQKCIRTFECDASNRSSSGSANSYPESCTNFNATDASDWAGSVLSNASQVPVPSKKRSAINLKPSSVDKLTMELYSIWNEQQSSNLSASSEEDLLFEGKTQIDSVEIGHGGFLLPYPISKGVEEESEASSIPADNKLVCEAYSRPSSFFMHSTNFSNVSLGEVKKPMVHMIQENARREAFPPENLNLLQDKDSVLSYIDLKHMQVDEESKVDNRTNFLPQSNLTAIDRPHQDQIQQLQESNRSMMSSNVYETGSTDFTSTNSSVTNPIDKGSKETIDTEEFVDNEGTCLGSESLFASSPDRSLMLLFTDESSDQHLLLDQKQNSSIIPGTRKTPSKSSLALSNCCS